MQGSYVEFEKMKKKAPMPKSKQVKADKERRKNKRLKANR